MIITVAAAKSNAQLCSNYMYDNFLRKRLQDRHNQATGSKESKSTLHVDLPVRVHREKKQLRRGRAILILVDALLVMMGSWQDIPAENTAGMSRVAEQREHKFRLWRWMSLRSARLMASCYAFILCTFMICAFMLCTFIVCTFIVCTFILCTFVLCTQCAFVLRGAHSSRH